MDDVRWSGRRRTLDLREQRGHGKDVEVYNSNRRPPTNCRELTGPPDSQPEGWCPNPPAAPTGPRHPETPKNRLHVATGAIRRLFGCGHRRGSGRVARSGAAGIRRAAAALLALAALWLQPNAAQAQSTTLWSETMTVGSYTSGDQTTFYGWDMLGLHAGAALGDQQFDYDGDTYAFAQIQVIGGTLSVTFTSANPGDIATQATRDKLEFHVGTDVFEFGMGTFNPDSKAVRWTSTGLDWSSVTTVDLKIVEKVEAPAAVGNLAAEIRHPTGATGAGNGQVVLRFDPPTDGGGATVSYRFRVKEGDGVFGSWMNMADTDLEADPNTGRLGYRATGLTTVDHNDRTVPSSYTFEVQAVNSGGQSMASQANVTPYKYWFELAPRNWTAAQTSQGFEEGSTVGFTLSVKSTKLSGCIVASSFRPNWSAKDARGFVSGSKTGRLTFSACQLSQTLDIGTDDDGDNEAENGEVTIALTSITSPMYVGDTPPSVTFTVLDNDDNLPARPTNLTATPDDGEVGLRWTAGDEGGGAITKHQYCRKVGGGTCAASDWANIPNSAAGATNATSYTVMNLTNGTTYAFRVRAVNAHGAGAASNAVSATPRQPTPPGVPTDPAPASGDGEATLQWGPPEDDGGLPILRYEYRRDCGGPAAECQWASIPNSAAGEMNAGRYTIGNLRNGERYEFRVRAVNEVGAGPDLSMEVLPRAGAPNPPGNFKVESHPPRSLRLSWTEPLARAGVTTLGYDVRRQDNDSGAQYAPGTTEVIIGFGPTPVTHCYRIRTLFESADGEHGMSEYSPWECGTTAGGPGDAERVGIGVASVEAHESVDRAIEFPVSLTRAAETTVTAYYATDDVTAKAGEDYVSTSGTLTFAPGETSKTVSVTLIDDHIEDPYETFTLELFGAEGAELRHAVATGTIHNSENATLSSIAVADAAADEAGTLDFVVALELAATGTVTVDYATADGTATAGVDYAAATGTLTFRAGTTSQTVRVSTSADTLDEGNETFTLTLSNASGAALGDAEATGTIRDTEWNSAAALTAEYPPSPFASALHKGADDRPQVVVAFNRPVAAFDKTTPSVVVTGGAAHAVGRHEEEGLEHAWLFWLAPAGTDAMTFTLVAEVACDAGGICTDGGTMLTGVPEVRTLPGPASDSPAPNTAATGAPTISGTAQAGETLTASVSAIDDADGMENASFAYQWIGNSGSGDADIGGETSSTYTLADADVGKTIKVRVSFTDDAGSEETLTSSATEAVTARPVGQEPLTASFTGVPAEHTGEEFTFGLSFSEEVKLSYRTLRDEALDASGGTVRRAKCAQEGNQEWEITVEPDSGGAVTIRLSETTDCDASGAICTHDGKPLSNGPSVTVPGPDTPSNAPPSALSALRTDPSLRMDPSDHIVRVGETALYTITLDPGTASPGEVVRLACEGLPANAGCAFSPASLVAGDEPVTATLSVTTASRSAEVSFAPEVLGGRGPAGGVWLMLVGMAVLGLALGTREGEPQRRRIRIPALLILVVLSMQSGCAGDLPTAPGRPTVEPGAYTFTVVARSEAGEEVSTVATTLTVW